MSDKFKGKYSRASLRADWIDYSNTAIFHITICTQNREHYFGAFKDGKNDPQHSRGIGYWNVTNYIRNNVRNWKPYKYL